MGAWCQQGDCLALDKASGRRGWAHQRAGFSETGPPDWYNLDIRQGGSGDRRTSSPLFLTAGTPKPVAHRDRNPKRVLAAGLATAD
ncbi:hypothetical protein ACJEI0_23980, partial [Escherichia coli]